jgi:2-polyprenyl-6-methoxyphenol hydroxylase-like FAD-dependent oxidoreductase
MDGRYDVIVVGARCAGAPTAMHLARAGYRVLLVDRATFPSDTVSTLVIHARGIAALRRWGVLDEVTASGCPGISTYSFDFGPFAISGRPRPVDGNSLAHAPRRTVLDTILVEAAARAGAEVRQRFSVEEILIEDGVVVGIRGHDDGGRTVEEQARVVVGADGHTSRVARAVGAEQYRELPLLEHAFYSYWSDLPVDAFTIFVRGDRAIAAIPTNGGLTLLLVACPPEHTPVFKADVEPSFLAAIDREPDLAERLRSATRQDRFWFGGVPNFFRVPYGNGWALVGDAGYTKDPVTAQGISDALCGAERCATALDEALSGARPFADALGDYHRERDDAAAPIYEFTAQLASFEEPPPEMQQLLAATAADPAASDDFASVTAGSLSPTDFLAPSNIERIMASASRG